MQINNPNVSVIIPTYNRPEGLRNAIVSVFNQTVLPDELIIVDDGSTPPVSELVFSDKPDHLRTLLLRNSVSRGANYSRNKGAYRAKSTIVAFLDDDDEWGVHKIDRQLQFMKSEGAALSYTGKDIITISKEKSIISTKYSFSKPSTDNLGYEIMKKNFVGTTSSIMVEKEKFLEVGGFDTAMPAMQDYDLYIRLILNGINVRGLDEPLLRYHIIEGQDAISKKIGKKLKAVYLLTRKYIAERHSYFLPIKFLKVIGSHFIK